MPITNGEESKALAISVAPAPFNFKTKNIILPPNNVPRIIDTATKISNAGKIVVIFLLYISKLSFIKVVKFFIILIHC